MNKKTTKNENNAALVSAVTGEQLGLQPAEKVHSVGFSTWVRALMQNWRQGTVAVKGRADVSFSNKKPWKQKGTGRARAGSPRSPLWRKGGVTFGPQPRVRTLQVNKQIKKNVLRDLASMYAHNGNIFALDWTLTEQKPKTALAFNALKQAQLTAKPVNLFLSVDDMLSFASFANIPNVRILFFDQANAFDLAQGAQWVFLKKDFDHFKNMVSQWI